MLRRSPLALLLLVLFAIGTSIAQSTDQKSEPVLDVTSIDNRIDPCTDFFQYSCGNWIKKNPIPPDQVSWSVYSKLDDDNKLILRDILEKAAAAKAAHGSVRQKIGDYYAACMDEKAIDADGLKPLQPALDRISGMTSTRDIAGVEAAMIYNNAMFRFGSSQDYKNSSQMIAQADQGGLGLPDRDYYLKDDPKSVELRKQYLAHVQKMFDLLGDKPETAAKETQAVMKIETALAKGSLTRVERRDPQKLDHKMTVKDLDGINPAFSWNVYLAKVGIPSVQSLNVTSPEFFKTLNSALDNENLASWKAYLRWHLVHANASFLPTAFVNESFDFYGKKLEGAEELRPRWKRCVDYVDDDLGEALGQAYVQEKFSPEAKQRALTMVKQIEAAMQSDIESLPWMSETTKQQALVKLHAVANKIGYPDKWRDYSALNIEPDDELGNVLRSRAFEFHRDLGKIGKPVDRSEWEMTPPTVNAYYDPQMNNINFPAGILQPPLFDPDADDAPNYGDTGGTVGHELTHAFDDEGRQFDAQGNLRDWWTPEDEKKFKERASCITDQYAQYTVVDDIKINSKLTLGEDVADLGGLTLAYMAWQDQEKGKQLEPIDGFTPAQRFFIGYGQSWCGSTRDATKRMWATIDPHSPDKYRANGVVSNLAQFQEAFHCKAGAPMVRENRCRVW
jgi:putative endopeptidase